MDDIADKLGCSKKTLYVFFENRKDLVLKVISNDMKKHELEISNVIAEKLHPIEEILSLKLYIQRLEEKLEDCKYKIRELRAKLRPPSNDETRAQEYLSQQKQNTKDMMRRYNFTY